MLKVEIILISLTLLLVIAICQGQNAKSLICPLVWVPSSTGSTPPSNALEIHSGKKQFAARGEFETLSGQRVTVVGTYDPVIEVAIFPIENENGTTTVLSSFEILTNPHNCIIKWPQKRGGQIADFSVSAGGATKIGRAMMDKNLDTALWLTGIIDPSAGGIYLPFEMEKVTSDTYQVLTSYSSGLRLEVTQLVTEEDPFGNKLDFLGVDVFHNGADSEITQHMSHHKKVVETSSWSTSRTTTSSKTDKSGWDVLVVGKQKKAEHTYSETVTETFTTITEVDINTTKDITIPPYSSVTACTSITMKEDIEISFTAKGAYSAPGWTPQEVQAFLKSDGITTATIIGEEVVVNMEGTFKGNLALNNQFIAVPADDPAGCNALQQKIFDQNTKIRQAHMNKSLAA